MVKIASTLRVLLGCVVSVLMLTLTTASTGSNTPASLITRTLRPTRTVSTARRTTTPITGQSSIATATALKSRVNATVTAYTARISPTLTALAIKVNRTATLPADQAAAAISSYASSVLGTAVTVTKAGGITAEVTRNLYQTKESALAQAAAVKTAVEAYGATLSNGAATLTYGSGTISGNITIDVQDESLGVYSLVVNTTGALNASSALALATQTFPNLAGLPYESYSVSTGFAWYATSTVPIIDIKSGRVTTTVQAVILYVVSLGNNRASITASVGRGDYSTLIASSR